MHIVAAGLSLLPQQSRRIGLLRLRQTVEVAEASLLREVGEFRRASSRFSMMKIIGSSEIIFVSRREENGA